MSTFDIRHDQVANLQGWLDSLAFALGANEIANAHSSAAAMLDILTPLRDDLLDQVRREDDTIDEV